MVGNNDDLVMKSRRYGPRVDDPNTTDSTSRGEQGWRHMGLACELHDNGQYKAAMKEYLASIRCGNVHARHNLADLLSDEKSGFFNFERAVSHYKAAIRHGLPESAFALAITYKMNSRVRGWKYWLRRAADMGNDDAKEELSRLLK